MSLQPRLLLLHKHRTSGRVRYLRLPDGMLAFAPLPALAMLRDPGYAPKLYFHPATVTREAEAWLALPAGRENNRSSLCAQMAAKNLLRLRRLTLKYRITPKRDADDVDVLHAGTLRLQAIEGVAHQFGLARGFGRWRRKLKCTELAVEGITLLLRCSGCRRQYGAQECSD